MGRSSRLMRLDAFTKTVEDARIRTSSGGIVTIFSALVILFLVIGEWNDYRKISVISELIVDKTRGEQMEIHLNITFPHIPCELLTLDVMDVSGDLQPSVSHGIGKHRLDKEGNIIESKFLELHPDHPKHLDPNYCGECYGAIAPETSKKAGCCQTCDDVREAYAAKGWAFGDGTGVHQCEEEGYKEMLKEQAEEGCRIDGHLWVNKVVGNFHIAPGKSFSNAQMHVHDLANYLQGDVHHDFTHTINALSFGPPLPTDLLHESHHQQNPLDNTAKKTNDRNYNYLYFLKIVSTSYEHLDHGYTINTHQYSVTSHERSLEGGKDDVHPGTVHARGGIPGIFFSYDISPMKVVNREIRTKSFTGFLTSICAIIGGTLTVAAALDRGLYEGARRIGKVHQR
ncbi:uncharacterized protein DFL_004175 [Arthrobotrys flagrans]|uniref:Endoplasmic reticulum-Golgi intermediate compartment protein n=1 Tax=Arthrobotrys flagrans TaxID=97331 RepID=A0A437A3Y7_ARTFL|nr:hypothetical protein DFL_004175 [Arthrobotrys flagrans]